MKNFMTSLQHSPKGSCLGQTSPQPCLSWGSAGFQKAQKIILSEVRGRTAQHTECSSKMVLFDTNLVKCSIFSFLLSLKRRPHLSKFIQYTVRAPHSCSQTIKKSRYSPAPMLESAVHKNNYINSTPCSFCSPEKCGSWGW